MRRFDKFCDKVRYLRYVHGSKYNYYWDEERGLIWRERPTGYLEAFAVTDGEEWFNRVYMLKYKIYRRDDFE